MAARLPGDSAPADNAAPARLAAAMRYACLGGGKRFRAMLVYAAGELAGAEAAALDAPAAAVEMLHAYSLIHDDLPAMDDDDLRRGRPACHIAFGEAAAILAGDALQSLAFEVLGGDRALGASAARRLRMVGVLAAAAGARGMAGGQALDMQATVTDTVDTAVTNTVSDTAANLARIHRLKTGALIRASAQLGALAAAESGDELIARLDEYAADLGLAFQIADDILDAEAAPGGGELGKRGGSDKRMHKATYAEVLGVQAARSEAQKHAARAAAVAASLRDFGDNAAVARAATVAPADFLAQLARFAVNRSF